MHAAQFVKKARHHRWINAGLALTFAILIGIGWLAARNMAAMTIADRAATHAHLVIEALGELISSMKDVETGQRGFVITGEEQYLEHYHPALGRLNLGQASLRQLTRNNPRQQKRLDVIELLIQAKLDFTRQTIQLRSTQGFQAAYQLLSTDRGKALMDDIRREVAQAQAEERRLLAERSATKAADTRRAIQSLVLGGALSLAILLLLFLLLKRELVQRLRVEQELLHHRNHLQELVEERAGELKVANTQLTNEIEERRRAAEEARQGREWLQVTLTSIGDAVIACDTAGRIAFLNPVAAAMTAWSVEEALGQPIGSVFRIINEATLEPAADLVDKVLREGCVIGLANHTALVTRDGRRIPIEDSAAPIRDTSGNVAGVVLVFHDVTQRRRAEESLRLRNERLALLSDAAAHLLKAENPDTMVRELFEKVSRHLDVHAYFNFMVNEAGDALRLDSCAGIPEEVARSIERLDFGVAVCGTVALLRQAIYATEIQTSDDEKVQLVKGFGIRAYACNPLMAGERLLGTLSFASRAKDCFDEDELEFMRTVCHYVAMAKERLRMERELRRHLERLAENDRRKDEFLAMLAHELRNPLAPVRNAVQVMRMVGSADPVLQRQRDVVDRQVTHMARLLDDLLDVARITQGKIELRKRPVQLGDVLTQAVEVSCATLQARRHELFLEPPPEDLRLIADPDRLIQVVGNLLTNAAKYTPEGGRIWLEAAAEGQDAIIHVRDDGAGIDAQLLPRIFDLFSQADQGLAHAQGGLGIGLTMVRRLVELHGGAVEARSAGPGQGSEFIVRLPMAPHEFPEPVQSPASGDGAADHSSRRILVVDDIEVVAETLAEMLGLMGHEVRMALSGAAALEAARAFQPEVVLLDIGMPGMDGYETARRLRQEHGERPLIVAVTGYAQESNREASREAGFNHHLAKPVDLGILQNLLSLSTV